MESGALLYVVGCDADEQGQQPHEEEQAPEEDESADAENSELKGCSFGDL